MGYAKQHGRVRRVLRRRGVSSHLSGGSLVRAAIQPNPGLGKKLRIMVDRLLTIYRVRVRVREVNQHK